MCTYSPRCYIGELEEGDLLGVKTLLTVTEKYCVITCDPSDTETGWAT